MTIRAENCGLEVDHTSLLSQVSMSINGGEIVTLIGANGAGKTSLLRLLCGEQKPSSGQIFLGDQVLPSVDLSLRAQRIAVLPQRSGLDFPFLVPEVIEMGRYPQFTSKQINREIVDQVQARLGLEPFKLRRYTTLSGGERQRVQLARVLAQLWDRTDQAYYFFDEPTAPLDLAHQLEFFNLVQDVARKGAAILLVVHDINLAARFSDRLILLKNGSIIADGVPNQVVTRENIRLAFDVEVETSLQSSTGIVQISY